MRLWEKITLSIVVVFIAGFVALGVWQSNNIRTVFMVLTKSSEQIAAEMDANKKRLEDELVKKYPTIIGDFTAEEEKMIMKGEITFEEAEKIIRERYGAKKRELEGVSGEDSEMVNFNIESGIILPGKQGSDAESGGTFPEIQGG